MSKSVQLNTIDNFLLYTTPDGSVKVEVLIKNKTIWLDTHKMPNQTASHIHTAVMHACVPEAVGIAKDLGLPPPIPLPQVRLGAKPSKGQFSPEVA